MNICVTKDFIDSVKKQTNDLFTISFEEILNHLNSNYFATNMLENKLKEQKLVNVVFNFIPLNINKKRSLIHIIDFFDKKDFGIVDFDSFMDSDREGYLHVNILNKALSKYLSRFEIYYQLAYKPKAMTPEDFNGRMDIFGIGLTYLEKEQVLAINVGVSFDEDMFEYILSEKDFEINLCSFHMDGKQIEYKNEENLINKNPGLYSFISYGKEQGFTNLINLPTINYHTYD